MELGNVQPNSAPRAGVNPAGQEPKPSAATHAPDETKPILKGVPGRPPIDNVTNQESGKAGVPAAAKQEGPQSQKSAPGVGQTPAAPIAKSGVNAGAPAAKPDAGGIEQASVETSRKEEIRNKNEDKAIKSTADKIVNKISENELIEGIKNTINEQTQKLSRKVNRSVVVYMFKKGMLDESHAKEAEELLTVKVPKVLAGEISAMLADTFGLEQVEKSPQ